MASSSDESKAQITESLSLAASDLERTADSWATIKQTTGLPKALCVVGEKLPILRVFITSLESSIQNTEETEDLKESFAAAHQFAVLFQQQAKYFVVIFNAVSTTDNRNTKEEKYRIAAEQCGGKPIEAMLKDLLQQAADVATKLVADEDLKSSLQTACDEVAKLAPSLAEGTKGPISISNNGHGTQLYHSGKGHQNHCSGGSQYTGDSCTFNMGPKT